ncbi:MAG TPA: DUF5309 family protein [Dissulfurispiraceae bacterium]
MLNKKNIGLLGLLVAVFAVIAAVKGVGALLALVPMFGTVLGMRGTGSFTTTGQRPENWEDRIIERYGNLAPLTAVLGMLPKGKATDDYKFHWFEEAWPTQRLRINNGPGYVAGDTTLTVYATDSSTPIAGAQSIRAGHILWNERTGEKMYVTTDPGSDTSIAVTRGYGTTSAAAINHQDWLTVLAATHGEGADVPQSIGYDPVEVNNYTQIMRVPIKLTGTALNTNFRTGDEYKNARRRALRDFSIHKEMSYIFGEYKLSTDSNGQRISTTRGIVEHLKAYASSNVITNVGALSESAFDGYMETLFTNTGSGNKLALCGAHVLNVLTQMAKGGKITMRDVPQNESYGMNLTRYITPFGELMIKQHALFSRHPVLTNNMLIVDTEYVKERPFKGDRGTVQVLKDRQSPGVDGKTDEYFQEAGIETQYGESHMYLTGITSFAP